MITNMNEHELLLPTVRSKQTHENMYKTPSKIF